MNDSKDNKRQAWALIKKASGILRPFINEPLNSDGSIRPQLIEGLDYTEEYLRIADSISDDFDASMISMNVMNLGFFLRNASPVEFQYAINRIIKWKNAGYKECNNALAHVLTSELHKESSDRRLNWTDHEYVDIILGCKATIGSSLSNLLHIPAVREAYIKKSSEGERRYTFELGTYYYDSEEYTAAFNTLKNLKDDHTAKYLGLMYYYGKGTEPNLELAREYLERAYETIWYVEPEVTWALGNLYSNYDGAQKQFDLFITELEDPYVDYNNPFIQRMLKQCMTLLRHTMVKDYLFMIIEVDPEDLECEFSLDIAPYCHFTVNWDNETCEIYGNLEKNGTVTCRHKYLSSGTYTIIIESLWEKVIEGFDFSRHKRQLHTIYLGDCPGLKRLSIVCQRLTNLDLTPRGYRKDFLTGVICRDNEINKLDLCGCPKLAQLDCSENKIKTLKLPKSSALSRASLPASIVNKSKVDEILRLNRGYYCGPMDYNDLSPIDMRLEYHFRCSTWDKVRKYIRKNERDYYDHALTECELAFAKLKELSKNININPYEEKGGFLAVHDSYVSDNMILHTEEFFIVEENWTTCLATKVRDLRRREPWMRFLPAPPEYYVASCLVNMIQNRREIKNQYKITGIFSPVLQNETGIN